MKSLFALVGLLCLVFESSAQIVTHPSGKIEIPNVNQTDGPLTGGSLLWFSSGNTSTAIQENWGLNLVGAGDRPVKLRGASLLVGYQSNGQDLGADHMMIKGNLGVGTLSPLGKLHVNALPDASLSAIRIGDPNSGNVNVPYGASPGAYNIDFQTWRDIVPDQIGARIRAERLNIYQANNALIQSMDLAFFTSLGYEQSNLTEKLRIKSDGNVGIGTSSPDAKLAVNGTLHAREVKVDLAFPAPDYVFEKNYTLRSLTALDRYINIHKHLPEIPSAKEMEKNGVLQGEMNMQLLKKIEELTLYLIEKNKEVKNLQRRVSAMESQRKKHRRS